MCHEFGHDSMGTVLDRLWGAAAVMSTIKGARVTFGVRIRKTPISLRAHLRTLATDRRPFMRSSCDPAPIPVEDRRAHF